MSFAVVMPAWRMRWSMHYMSGPIAVQGSGTPWLPMTETLCKKFQPMPATLLSASCLKIVMALHALTPTAADHL